MTQVQNGKKANIRRFLRSSGGTPASLIAVFGCTLGIRINLLNPKLSIVFFAFRPQFVGIDEAGPVLRMGKLSLVFMALTFFVFAAYGTCAARLRRHILSSPTVQIWMRRSLALALGALTMQLALSGG